MPIVDYSEKVDRMQQELARRYLRAMDIINVPGRSSICKIDPFYYLALYPGFHELLAKWCGFTPGGAREALVKTGNMMVSKENRLPSLKLTVGWPNLMGTQMSVTQVEVCFIHNSFVDRALVMYAKKGEAGVSDLRIFIGDKPKVDAFLQDKTNVRDMAYYDPEEAIGV